MHITAGGSLRPAELLAAVGLDPGDGSTISSQNRRPVGIMIPHDTPANDNRPGREDVHDGHATLCTGRSD